MKKIKSIKIGENQYEITDEEARTNIDNMQTKRYVMIGDSYVTGTLDGVKFATDGWADRIKTNKNLSDVNCYIFGEGGAGFTKAGNTGYTFKTLLTSNLDSIQNKDTIDYVIVCGGYNDISSTVSNIENKINDFANLVKTNFPNAKLYVGCIGNTSAISDGGTTTRRDINHISLPAYKNCIKYGAYYLNGVENILKDYGLMGTDFFHPSDNGYNELAYGIVQALETGFYSRITEVISLSFSQIEGKEYTSTNLAGSTKITNDTLLLIISGTLTFTNSFNITTGNDIELFTINSKHIRKKFNSDLSIMGCLVTVGEDKVPVEAYLYINNNNNLVINFKTHPEGVTSINTVTLRINTRFNINE